MNYRGYWVTKMEYGMCQFWIGDEDNYDAEWDDGWKDNATTASSIEDAKQQIDDLILENTVWEVCALEGCEPEIFYTLEEALKSAISSNAFSLTPIVDKERINDWS